MAFPQLAALIHRFAEEEGLQLQWCCSNASVVDPFDAIVNQFAGPQELQPKRTPKPTISIKNSRILAIAK
jgi:hypothetical protein